MFVLSRIVRAPSSTGAVMHRIAQLIRGATLGRSEARLCAFVESSPLPAAIVDSDGRPFHTNPAWQSLWGDGAASVLSRVPDLTPICRAAGSGETVVTPAICVPGAGAPERWVRAYLFPVRRSAPAIEVGIVLEEVTAQRRAEDAIRDAHRRESLGTLAGGIAHDFNNLLTGILGNASIISEILPRSNPAQPLLREMTTATQRLSDLTRQLLAYAGKGTFALSSINLSELVREISSLIQASVPKNVQVRLQLDDQIPTITSDPSQIQQIIMNLIIN